MRIQDFALLALVCMVWGLNFVVTKWVVAGDGVLEGYQGLPPFFAAGLRFTLAALVLLPLLRPLPRRFPDVVMVGLLFGALHFGLLYMGLKWSTASAAAVVIQLGVPFTTMLSVFLLGERIGVRRITGIALAVTGVVVISLDPNTAQLSIGLLLVAVAAFAGALGSILVKRLDVVQPVRLQAWIGAVSALPLIVMSALFETDQVLGLMSGGWRLVAAFAFIVLAVSIFAHAGY
ncbi:MAG: EamA family transporter, partial [Maricaulaceae bacterium]